MARSYEEVAAMFKSIANLGKGVHHGALSTTRANSDSRKLYAPNSPNTSESMPYSAWNVVGTFADVAPHVILFREVGESRIYHLAPAAASNSAGPTGDNAGGRNSATPQVPSSPTQTHAERNVPINEVNRLVLHIRKTLGNLDAPLRDDEWYSSLALCVMDAVYSMGVRYESVQAAVSNFCWWAHWERDLAKAPREYTVSEFVTLLDSFNRDLERFMISSWVLHIFVELAIQEKWEISV